jgi:hypothetical protein
MNFISTKLYFYFTITPGIDTARSEHPIPHLKIILQRVWLTENKNISSPVAAWRLGTVRPTPTPTTPIAVKRLATTQTIMGPLFPANSVRILQQVEDV